MAPRLWSAGTVPERRRVGRAEGGQTAAGERDR